MQSGLKKQVRPMQSLTVASSYPENYCQQFLLDLKSQKDLEKKRS